MFHDESWKSFVLGSKGQRSCVTKPALAWVLPCECWLLLYIVQ